MDKIQIIQDMDKALLVMQNVALWMEKRENQCQNGGSLKT